MSPRQVPLINKIIPIDVSFHFPSSPSLGKKIPAKSAPTKVPTDLVVKIIETSEFSTPQFSASDGSVGPGTDLNKYFSLQNNSLWTQRRYNILRCL